MGWGCCFDCKERLQVDPDDYNLQSINKLELFMVKHTGHDLIFNADDNWTMILDCTNFEMLKE